MSTTIDSIDNVSQVQNVQPIDSVDSGDSVQAKVKEAEPVNIAVTSTASTNNLFALAVELSFSQIGLFDSSSTSSDDSFSSVPTQQIVLIPFMNSLLNALQAQSTQNSVSPTTLSPAEIALNIANSGTFGITGYEEHHYYHGGENSGLLADLQSLIQKVASADPASSVGRYDNSALFSLIQNFQMLLSSTGTSKKTGVNIALDTFLKAFLKNIQDGDPEGNFIDTID
ncbi:MAG: hypothetical protein WC799_06550 [Desulfobacteraceae bacterium]|jgi:hypothetical protein